MKGKQDKTQEEDLYSALPGYLAIPSLFVLYMQWEAIDEPSKEKSSNLVDELERQQERKPIIKMLQEFQFRDVQH